MPQGNNILPPYIGGRFLSLSKPERTFHAANPARPNEILAVTGWQKELVGPIVDGMRAAQPGYAALALEERLALVSKVIDHLRANVTELKSKMILELGRSPLAVQEEWNLCEELFQVLPRFCRTALEEKKEHDGACWIHTPVGLVFISGNVSLPVYTLLSTALPALAAGNAVLIRPSFHCPLSATVLTQCFHQAQVPPGLFQMVFGDLEVCRRIVQTHQFDTILYVGGEESSEQIRKDTLNSPNTRLLVCNGGKNAALVTPSMNMAEVIPDILYGACVDGGQRLESTGLVFVQEAVLEEFCERFVQAIKLMPIAARHELKDDMTHVMSPLCSANAHERYLRFQGIAARESVETLRWGKSIDNPGSGYYVSPGVHLLSKEKVTQTVYGTNALFGPDVAIVPYSNMEEAITLLDSLRAARAFSVHSSTEEDAQKAYQLSSVPTILWNAPTTTLDPLLPVIGRGRAGNSMVTGLRFLFSTVFPKTLNLSRKKSSMLKLAMLFLCVLVPAMTVSSPQTAFASYQKAVEGNEVVKDKIYPRSGRFQLNALQGGLILNQSFVDTFLGSAGATYHFNEWHAVSVEGFLGVNRDRGERVCVENFFLNTERAGAQGARVCEIEDDVASEENLAFDPRRVPAGEQKPPSMSEEDWEREKVRSPFLRKPAYMAIREIKQMYNVNYQWTPVYGKALYFLSTVGYLDFYTNLGLGVAVSDYWAHDDTRIKNTEGDIVGTAARDSFGRLGRPEVQSQMSPAFSAGLGNRFFFMKNFLVNMEFRNFTIFGQDGKGGTDFMNFFALWGGVGILF